MTFDFITYILNIWKEEWDKTGRTTYLDSEKDRKATGLLLKKAKKAWPDLDTEDISNKLRQYFKDALQIQDKWYSKNMSLSLLNSKPNEINQYIKEIRKDREAYDFKQRTQRGMSNLAKNEEVQKLVESKKWNPAEDKEFQKLKTNGE